MIPASVMMGLGAFRFGMQREAYQKFSQTAGFRWHKVNGIGVAPELQYAGPDARKLTIEGVIYPHYRGGLGQVEMMRQQGATGAPLMLVDGMGGIWRRWVINSVDETQSYFMADGAPRKIEFQLALTAYGGGKTSDTLALLRALL